MEQAERDTWIQRVQSAVLRGEAVERELSALKAENERMRPVVAAARVYADALANSNAREPRRNRAHLELLLAVQNEEGLAVVTLKGAP